MNRNILFGCITLGAVLCCGAVDAQNNPSNPVGVCKDARGCGPSTTPSPAQAPSGPSAEEVRRQRERLRQRAKEWSSDEAMDYFERKDWDNAIRSFEEALDRDPDDPDLNEWLRRAKAEKARSRLPAVAAPPRPAAVPEDKVADARKSPRVGDDLLAQVPELRNSPEAERIRKGYQALLSRDWPVALLWWKEALARDPNNGALKRSADLAQWMVDRQKEVKPGPVTLFGAANAAVKRGDYDRALQLLQQLKTANPAMKGPADRMIEETQKLRMNIQLPEQSDIEFLFPSPYARAITALTKNDYSSALDLLGQVKRAQPALAAMTDRMIANVRLLSPLQLPDPGDSEFLFPERAYAGPMSGSGLELIADGYNRKAKEIFDRIRASTSRRAR